jgi:arylsulfatase A-like enzyme
MSEVDNKMITKYILSLGAIVAFLGLVSGAQATEPVRPNVLMICIDDMNDWVGFLDGHPQSKTPNMDQLAAKGVNFTRAYCTSPGCSPSRNALLFGVEPYHSGLYPFYNINHIAPGVLDDYTALPLLFRQNGYRTIGISKVFHNPDNSYRQDELWDDYKMLSGDGPKNLWIKEKGYHPDPFNKRTIACPSSAPLEKFGDYQAAMRAVKFLEQDQSKPFFLAVGFIKPHTSFIMPEENWDRFKEPIQSPPIKADDLIDIPIAGQSNAQIYVEIPLRKDDAWEDVRRGYLACINFTDDNVGRVLTALEQSRYADNTIVVLWSDHGFHLGEKRTFSKFSLWEEGTRTPFIIWDSRRKGNGQACAAPVGLINVYKTLCDLVGLKAPDYVDGQSLRPWLDDPQLPKESPATTTWGRGNYTLRTTDWRYTRYFDGSEELYSETDDPNEWTNLANDPKYSALKNELADKWLPKQEAAQVTTGIELYNVADADSPTKAIRSYQENVKKYQALKLQPSLD